MIPYALRAMRKQAEGNIVKKIKIKKSSASAADRIYSNLQVFVFVEKKVDIIQRYPTKTYGGAK